MDQKVKELLLNEADNHKDRLVSLVSKLTQFDSFIGEEREVAHFVKDELHNICLLYTSPSPRDGCRSRMPSSA